ncbi:MAG TPA: hypothetical protein ENG62_00230 [Thermoplasmatales archaeon]|nr:hypothetical protein [Thermoplasmatales archaeon]
MNREGIPLLIGVTLPILLVGLYLLERLDVIEVFSNIDIIYYIAMIPFGLGLLVCVFYWNERR